MEETITCQWNSDMQFTAEVNGHEIVFDAVEKVGGHDNGPRPKPVVLACLAGCSGMDVVYLLKKMRIFPKYFNLRVSGTPQEEHPKYYYKIKIIYEFKKEENLNENKIQRAVELSQDKYCGVGGLLKRGCELTYEIEYI